MQERSEKRSNPPATTSNRRPSPAAHKYIYAIVGERHADNYGPIGLGGKPVEFINVRGLSAVVSEIGPERIRPDRYHLAGHQQVLSRLIAREETVLPLAFGSIARGEEAICALLTRNRSAFVHKLERVAGRVEMGLRVVWQVPNIFEYFLDRSPELRAARDRVFGRQGQAPQDERIELGRMFDRVLTETRNDAADTVEGVLSRCCVEIARGPLRDEREVMKLACLIERRRRDDFEATVLEAAGHFDNNFAFDYNGPWAAHSFAEMKLED